QRHPPYGNIPSSELQIYYSCERSNPDAKKPRAYFGFAIVYTDPKTTRLKDIGNTLSGWKGPDDAMTLQSQRFQIGDYLDITVTPPNRATPSPGARDPIDTRRPAWGSTCPPIA
uniref:18 kDa Sin3-associated polypeptide n=1 Tax=Oncorhynchus kisutch TaxID=8019 RepID=A0A8C7F003_ONCKI